MNPRAWANTHRLARPFAAVVLAIAISAPGSALDLPGRDASERPVPLRELPARVELERYRVVVRTPADPDLRAGGGSGGPVLEIVVERRDGSRRWTTHQQVIALWVADRGAAPPEFSSWSKTGASHYVSCRLRADAGRYCPAFCEDHEQGADGLRRTGAPRTDQGCER